MIRYLVAQIDGNGREVGDIWDEVSTNHVYHRGDIITRPNGEQYIVKFVEGKAFNGKR